MDKREWEEITVGGARRLVEDGDTRLIHWRPDGKINYRNPDSDLAKVVKNEE